MTVFSAIHALNANTLTYPRDYKSGSSSLVLIAIRIVLGVHSVDPVVFPCLLGSSDLAKNVSGSAEGVRVALRSCHATPTNGYVKKDV